MDSDSFGNRSCGNASGYKTSGEAQIKKHQ